VATLDLQPHEVAYALAKDAVSVSWDDACGPFRKITDARNLGTDLEHVVRSHVDSLDPIYLLVVVENTVKVLYGLKPCHATSGNGKRFLGLIGEREIRAGQEVQPKLHTLGGNLSKQVDHFANVDVAAPTLVDIEAMFQGDATLSLVAQLAADPTTNAAAPTIPAWMALPVHPKLACLFLRGMSVRNAFFLVKKIISAFPSSLSRDLEPLVNFIRSAVTTGAIGASSLTSGWKRESHTSSDPMETWFYELVARFALKFVPPIIHPVPTLLHAPPPQVPGQAMNASEAVLQELAAQLRGDQPKMKSYHSTELHTLFPICGVEQPWAGLTDASLPQFWIELKDFRKANSNARLFIENFRVVNYPPQRLVFPFLFTPQLIKDLKSLSFSGNDHLISFQMRHKGISIFSLAPTNETSADLGARDKYLQYEETMSHHAPADRAAMESLSMVAQAFPSDRIALYHWVDSFHVGIEIFFGYMCPLSSPCSDLLEILRNPVHFAGFSTCDYRALLWTIHKAIRFFFLNFQTNPFRRLTADLASGIRPATNVLPMEMRGPVHVFDDGSTTWNRPSGPPNPYESPSDPINLPGNKRQRTLESAPYASRFQPAWRKAMAHYTKITRQPNTAFRANKLCNRAQMHEIFGDEFLACATSEKPPCFRYHICGACSGGNSAAPCQLTHRFRSEPSTSILDGIQTRLDIHVQKYLTTTPKA
jgi:hypothetical protein